MVNIDFQIITNIQVDQVDQMMGSSAAQLITDQILLLGDFNAVSFQSRFWHPQ